MSEYLTIDPERQLRLKEIIARLHAGEKPAALKREFAALIKDVSALEIAAMEQALMDEGFPPEEIQRLCEVHVEVFKSSLEKGQRPATLPGHPVHTMIAENREATARIRTLSRLTLVARFGASNFEARRTALDELGSITMHYARKENQLFPYLERHGFTGPTRVMWGKHDEIRMLLKGASAALEKDARSFARALRKLARAMRKMIFMEERILLPDASKRLSDQEWAAIRKGEDAIGFAWVRPEALYDAGLVAPSPSEPMSSAKPTAPTKPTAQATSAASTAPLPVSEGEIQSDLLVNLNTGSLSLGILDLALRRLPVDFSIVDDQDRVIYYSDSPHRVFPRSPAVIGRSVQNCHPQKSVDTVNRILDSFRKREKSQARFWIEMGGIMIVIEYHALFDAQGRYRGTLEVSQDATELRALQGQRRLLDWD